MTQINKTAISFQWLPMDGAYFYTVYYSCSGSMTLGNSTNCHVAQLDTAGLILICKFTISAKVNMKGTLYEGERSSPITQGNKY